LFYNIGINEDLKTPRLASNPQGRRPGGQDAVSLYVLACKIFASFPFELKKVAGNSIDAAHSISRNISDGIDVYHKGL
jgi:hypothetical protein